jgi:hypothetical protein
MIRRLKLKEALDKNLIKIKLKANKMETRFQEITT